MSDIQLAGRSTVYGLFRARALHQSDHPALEMGAIRLTYAAVLAAADAAAADLAQRGIKRGDRVAVLSENRIEYLVIQLACAKLGAIVACQNWRLTPAELRHCIDLVAPSLLIASPRFAAQAEALSGPALPVADIEMIGQDTHAPAVAPAAEPEDGLLLIYTSGTTGLPKAALISHRAEIARMCVLRLDLRLNDDDNYLAWAPMFHMGGSEHSLATLMSGGLVIVTDGFDLDAMADALVNHRLGWLLLVPATIEPLLARLQANNIVARGVKVVGCMADLVPVNVIAAITTALDAPYLNTFGSTETGMPPLSANLIPIGVEPSSMAKRLSMMTEFRLVDAEGNDVPEDGVGEGAIRSPTLFSGYWNGEKANTEAFRHGWYHMGDLFRRSGDGGYEFAGRAKYLIKSGGENIYPAEIERVLLADPRIADAVAVRKPDARWGEVPVAFVAPNDPGLTVADVERLCQEQLAGYKRPREIHFIAFDDLPRSTSGKIQREELEARLR